MTPDGMEEQQARATEAMMAVSRTMTALVARTLSEVADQITVPQLRVLVLLSSRGPLNITTIAQHLFGAEGDEAVRQRLVVTAGVTLTGKGHDPQTGGSDR